MAKKAVKKKETPKKRDKYALVATFFAMWTMIVSPLWLENQYFNLTSAKGHAFLVGAGITLALLIYVAVTEKNVKPLLPQKNVTEISIVVFGIAAFISSLLSKFRLESLFGYEGWWVGGVQMVLFAVLVIFLSHKLEWTRLLEITIMSVGIIVYFIDLLHGAGVDFLFLHRNMYEEQYWQYLSLIGNINWFMGFIALTLPIILLRFLNNTNKSWDAFYCVYLFLSCVGIIFSRSDGVYIGLGICSFFAIPFIMSKAQYIRKFMLMIAMYGIAMTMTLFVPLFSHMAECDGICGMFARPVIAIGFAIVGATGYFFVKRFISELNPGISRVVTIVIELAMGAVVIFFLVDTIRNFDETWGTLRGQIWIHAVDAFKEMPLINKFIGFGPETLFNYNQALSEMRGEMVRVNHSDFMQFLVTNGIVGLVAWSTMWASLFVDYLRNRERNDIAIGFFVALSAYFGQSLVNSAECLSWPMLIVVMALYLHQSRMRWEDSEKK